MKNRYVLFIIIFILLTLHTFSGLFVNSMNIMKEGKVDYIEMIWEKEKGSVTNINIRYGESPNHLNRDGFLTRRSGRKLTFRSIQEAVNHIKKNGWSDVRSFIQCFSGKSVYHFFFKKIN